MEDPKIMQLEQAGEPIDWDKYLSRPKRDADVEYDTHVDLQLERQAKKAIRTGESGDLAEYMKMRKSRRQ